MGEDPYGVAIEMKSMAVEGNILHGDDQREMWLKLNDTILHGAISGAHLELNKGSRWVATADSDVALMGEMDSAQIDAPEGVTIRMRAGEQGSLKLASGGVLELVD